MKYILIVTMLIGLIGLTSCQKTNDTNSTNSTNSTINNQTNAVLNAVSSDLQKILTNQNILHKQIADTNNSKTLKLIKDLQNTVQKIKLYFYIFVGITIALILSIAFFGYRFYKLLTKKIYENKEYVLANTTVFNTALDNMRSNQNDFQNNIISNQVNFQNKVMNFLNNFVKENNVLVIEKDKKIQDLIQLLADKNAEVERQNQLIEKIKNEKARLKIKNGENQ